MTYTIEHKLISADTWHRIEPWNHEDFRKAYHQASKYLEDHGGYVRIVDADGKQRFMGYVTWGGDIWDDERRTIMELEHKATEYRATIDRLRANWPK